MNGLPLSRGQLACPERPVSGHARPARTRRRHAGSLVRTPLPHSSQQQGGEALCHSHLATYSTCVSNTSGQRAAQWTFDEPHEPGDVQGTRKTEQARLDRHAAKASTLPPRPTLITRLPSHLTPQVLTNAVLLVDKPQDWSSDEVARSLVWALKSSQLGYVGSLEPMASGLMVVLMGQATSLTLQLQCVPQQFTGVLQLGIETDTHDSCGRVTATAAWSHIFDEHIEEAASSLRGEIIQVPPAYTPVKQKSRPVYELAKRRPAEQLQPLAVRVTEFSLRRLEPGSPELAFSVTFARVGYVRSLVHDLGLALGSYAHVSSLRRESLGGFSVDDAWPLDVLLPTARKFKATVRRGLPGRKLG